MQFGSACPIKYPILGSPAIVILWLSSLDKDIILSSDKLEILVVLDAIINPKESLETTLIFLLSLIEKGIVTLNEPSLFTLKLSNFLSSI